jgi:hypothetical protein
VIYFWNWYEHKSVRHLLAGSVFSLLALLSDFEIATWFVLPIFILMAVRGTTLKKVLPILGASLVAIILYAVYRSFNIAEVETLAVYNPMIDFSDRGERLTMAFCSIGMYLKLLVIPDQLVSAYGSGHFSIVGWHDPMVYLAIIGTSLLGFIVVFFHKRLPLLSIGGLMVLLDVIPFTNIVSLQPTYFDEKVLFGATFGLSLMLASGIGYVFKIDPEESFKSTYMRKPAMASLVLILVCLASFQTYSRNYDWVNNYKLTTNDVEHSDNAVMNYQCGRFLRQEYLIYPVRDINAHVDSAAFYLERSITQSNKWPEPIIELGRLRLYESAQPEIALSLFQQAAELKGSDIEFILDVGRCLADLGRTGEAIEVFGELLEHDSENIDAIDAIVNLYLIANYTDEAEFVNQRFFQFHPDAYQPFEYQGMIVLARGDTAQALNYFLESLKRNDQNLALQYFYDQLNPNSVANNGR